MQRGSQSIYKNLFNEPVAEPVVQASLREKKIDAIIDYYYYNGRKEIMSNGKPIRMSYNSLMELVSETFFLSTYTIQDIIQNNIDRMAIVKQGYKNTDEREMRRLLRIKWPQFVWD